MPELDRRDFLKLVGAGAGAAAAAGCSDPVEKLVPYVVQPEEITPGIAVYYASTCRECPAACGLHVKTREGRPIKLEGNPDHPINKGVLCGRGHAALARTYHPDRYSGPRVRSAEGLGETSWDEAISSLSTRISGLRQKGQIGKLRVLGGDRGPTLNGLMDRWLRAIGADPDSQRLYDESFSLGALRAASEAVFGVASVPIFDLSGADYVLDIGSDFLETGLSPTEHSRQLADARDVKKHADGGTRLVSVGPRMNLTVSSADQWLPAAPGHEGRVALALARLVADRRTGTFPGLSGDTAALTQLLSSVDAAAVATAADLPLADLEALADHLAKARSAVALPPGIASQSTHAVADAAAVLILNAVLGSVGRGMKLPPRDSVPAGASGPELAKLVEEMKAGKVDVLLIHDANPVYSLPEELGFAEALSSVGLVVSFASMANETSELAGLVLPDHAPMESWGDAEPRAGIRSLVQPTVRPLHDTQSIGDTLLAIGRGLGDDVASRLPSGSLRKVLEQSWASPQWREVLSKGGTFGAPGGSVQGQIGAGIAKLSFDGPEFEGSGDLTLIAYPRSFMGDGSGAALSWMQETPDPVTKASWVSWAEISLATASRLGVTFGDVVSVATEQGSIELPAYPRGGVRDDVVAIGIGQGHTVGHYASLAVDGQPGVARGASVTSILPNRTDESGSRAWLTTRASVSGTGGFHRIPLSQWTDNQHERSLAPSVSLAALAGGHDDAHHDEHAAGGNPARGHFEHTDRGLVAPFDGAVDAAPGDPYRWGMVIDNDRCNGCSACIVACAVENNIPTVGEAQAVRHREMNWIRIERYVGDGDRSVGGAERRGWPDGERLGQTDIRHVPMLCQHCGAAPCESVCPVIATYHTPEGLNAMVYNRCVGTRYCANNCTYKVRRFNYFDYSAGNWPGLMPLSLNPDVTVRGQGVMEKCTFCVQRIQTARQPAKDEGRNIVDGEVQTACQQTCPSQAITFGNLREDGSRVRVAGDEPNRSYHSLYTLNTRPAITYLKQVDRTADGESHG